MNALTGRLMVESRPGSGLFLDVDAPPPSLAEAAVGLRHAQALRDVCWAHGEELATIPGAHAQPRGEHAFFTRAAAEAALARCGKYASREHAPLPNRWRLAVRQLTPQLYTVCIYSESGALAGWV